MQGEAATDRQVFALTGTDRVAFLQGLVSNDVRRLKQGAVHAALLTPQGKYLADFFLIEQGDAILLDVRDDIAEAVMQRLALYRLRADVAISPAGLHVQRGLGPAPEGAVADPRHPALGWRLYSAQPGGPAAIDWDALRVAHCIPETGHELIPGETFILEAGFERLNGVDHRKGCYVGQEVTARMKHKTELRKGLAVVDVVSGQAVSGSEIVNAEGKAAGRLHTVSGKRAIAYLRLDRAGHGMTAGQALLDWDGTLPG